MKTFEEIYRDVTERSGCNSGETFARAMFEEGMRQNLECCMDKPAGSYITIEGKRYTTRFGTVTFSTEEKKSLAERAEEIAERLLSSGPAHDLKAVLKEAVLTGYDLQKDDFDED